LPSRIADFVSDKNSLSLVAVLDENLDLAARLKRESGVIPALIPLAPPLVVGQGDDISNQTFVRVLNKDGIAEASFLAFGADVRGGVQVASGHNARGESVIAAAPISAINVREIRLFNHLGGLVGHVAPDAKIAAPYVIACRFLMENARSISRRFPNRRR
jgi:hypothetical protein